MDKIQSLNSVGKRTFVNCFETRKSKGRKLRERELREEDVPYSKEWQESSLRIKTSFFNKIFKEGTEREALKICCEANIPNQEKARELYEKYYY